MTGRLGEGVDQLAQADFSLLIRPNCSNAVPVQRPDGRTIEPEAHKYIAASRDTAAWRPVNSRVPL